MTNSKKPSILTPKTLLSGIAGIALIVGISLAPASFVYASGNDGPETNVSDAPMLAKPPIRLAKPPKTA